MFQRRYTSSGDQVATTNIQYALPVNVAAPWRKNKCSVCCEIESGGCGLLLIRGGRCWLQLSESHSPKCRPGLGALCDFSGLGELALVDAGFWPDIVVDCCSNHSRVESIEERVVIDRKALLDKWLQSSLVGASFPVGPCFPLR